MAKKESTEETTPINSDRLSLLKYRLELAKKFAKKPHKAYKALLDEYEISDTTELDEVRDKVRIGYVFRKTESEVPALFDDQPELFFKGKNPQIAEIEPVINSTYDWLWDTQNLEETIEDLAVYFELFGMAIVKSPWVTKTKKIQQESTQPVFDEMGQPIIDPQTGEQMMQTTIEELEVPLIDQPYARVVNPFKWFPSPEIKFAPTLDSEHCPYEFEEMSMTKEEIKAKFGKDVESNETMHIEDDIEKDTTLDQSTEVIKDDMKRCTVYEYYGTLPEDLAKGITNKDGQLVEWAYDKEYHIWLTKNEELLVEECPYEYKPTFVIGLYGMAHKFWKFGDAKHLMPLIQELEIYRSHILEHTRKMANPKPLIPNLANVDEKAFRNPIVGKPVKYDGTVAPSYLSPSQLGAEVQIGVEQARTDLEKTAPSFDLSGGGGQSSVRTPRGIQAFSEASDRGTRRKRKKIARFIRQLIIFQFKQLSQNWTPQDEKTIDVMGEEVEVSQEVLQLLGHSNLLSKLDIEVESLSINRVQMRLDALELWKEVKDRPDIFNITEIAKDLLQNGYNKKDADRYLISQEQQQQQIIKQFIAQIGETNPQLGGVLAQYMSTPNMQGMKQDAETEQMTQPPQLGEEQVAPQLPIAQ